MHSPALWRAGARAPRRARPLLSRARPALGAAALASVHLAHAGAAQAQTPPPQTPSTPWDAAVPDAALAPDVVAAPDAPPANVPPSNTSSCTDGWTERVARRVRPSVVVIERRGDLLGTGFVWRDRTFVATAEHVINDGTPLTVRTADGVRIDARISARDPVHDVAIVELTRPLPASAVPLALGDAPELGAPVMAVGHPFGDLPRSLSEFTGLLQWTATAGIVGGRNDRYVQSDALLNPGNSGGPLLDCDGRVVGISARTYEGIGMSVATPHLAALAAHLGRDRGHLGRWRFGLIASGAVAFRVGALDLAGMSVGATATGYDRLVLQARFTQLFGGAGPQGALLSNTQSMFQAELEAGVRIPLLRGSVPLHLTLGAGIAVGQLFNADTRLTAPNAMCEAAGLPVCVQSTTTTQTFYQPFASASLNIGRLFDVGYALQFDPLSPAQPIHRINMGFRLEF